MSVLSNKSGTWPWQMYCQIPTACTTTRPSWSPSLATFSADERRRDRTTSTREPPSLSFAKGITQMGTRSHPSLWKFAYAFRTHITSLKPTVVDLSSYHDNAASSDKNDDFSNIFLSSGFQPASIPSSKTMLAPLDPAGQQLIGHHILFKWPTFGRCLARISEQNHNDPKCKVCKQAVNFSVFKLP